MRLTSRKTLLIALLLLGATFVVELGGGILFRSLSLVSDSFHVLSDLTSILLAYGALSLALKKSPTEQMAFGYHRLEVISALFNGLLLSLISAFILVEAWERFQAPAAINTTGALIVAIMGFGINLIITLLFRGSHGEIKKDLNIQSAYLHIIGDLLASISVIVGILAIQIFQLPVIDPLVAGFISVLILYSGGRVLYKSSEILLHRSPQDIQYIRDRVMKIKGVEDIKDVRLWQVCSHLTVGTAHVVVSTKSLEETEPIKKEIKDIIQDEFDVRDITLECETVEMSVGHRHMFKHEHG